MNSAEVKIETLAHPERGSFKIGPFGSSLKKDELVNSGIPVAGIENVLPNNFVSYFRKFITKEKFQQLADYEVTSGDILVTTMGTIGRAAVVPDGIGTIIIDSHLFRMRVDKSKVYSTYLCYAINGYEGLKRQLAQMSRGAIMDGLNTTILKECSIPLPPLAEQKRIAAILEKCDRLRRTRRYTLQLSDTFLQSVFLEMFGDPVTNPMGWEMSDIGSLTKIETGGTPSRANESFYGGKIPWVKTTEVTNNIIYETEEKLTEEGLNSSNCRIFPKGTIIIAMYGQGLTRGRSAKLGIEASTNQACAAILPSPKINTNYLWAYLKLSYERLRDLGRGGNQPNLNLEMVRVFKIIVPPLPLQEKFAQIVQKYEQLRTQQRESDRQAEHLFQTLLHRAFRGDLTNKMGNTGFEPVTPSV